MKTTLKFFSIILICAFIFGFASPKPVSAATITVCASGCDFTTIQAAIDAAAAGDVITVADGTYTETLNIYKNLTITGESQAGVVIDTHSFNDYGIDVAGDIITAFTNFTLIGPAPAAYGYGLKVSGENAQTTIQYVTVQNSARSGIDLNGLVGGLIDHVTLTNNGGVGLALTDSSNISVTNITTSGNGWGGLAIYTGGASYTGGSDNITLSGTNSFSETNKFYIQTHGYPVTNLHQTDFAYSVINNTDLPGTIGFYKTQLEATAVALMAAHPAASVVTNQTDNSKLVAPGMSIQAAIDAAANGDTINVTAGTYVLGSAINVNKDVTLNGVGSPLLQVSGTGDRIFMTTAGATLQGFQIEKTDKAGIQNIIYVGANNLTIQNNKIWGHFVIGEDDVSRAMVFTGGLSGLLITNNEIFNLRQPGYISGVTTGTISNNLVYRTKGWVVEQGDMTFTGNTWGTGANANVYDIVILSTASPSYYTDIPAMSAANNNAFIEDQRTSPATLSIVYVDGSVTASGDGTARSPKKTIAEGVTRVIPGGTIHVAAGTYDEENIVITKGLKLLGAGADTTFIAPSTVTNNSTIVVQNPTANVLIDGFTFTMQPKINYGSAVVITGTTIPVDSATVTITHNIVNGSNDGTKSDYGFYGQGNNARVIITDNQINRTGDNPIVMEQQIGSSTVSNNIFRITDSPDYDAYFSMAYGGTSVTTPQIVEGNTFYLDHAGSGYSEAITFDTAVNNAWSGTTTDTGHYSDIQIRNNTIYTGGAYARGIGLFDLSSTAGFGTISGAKITGNQIIGESAADVQTFGLTLRGDVEGTLIQDNLISNINLGFWLRAGLNGIFPTGSDISDNSITPTVTALKNDGTTLVDASPNWWGTPSAAFIQAKLNGPVTFKPYWLNEEMTLLSGTLVTPVYVDDDYAAMIDCGAHICGYDAFSTVEDAIAVVSAGGTIHVAAGSYPESLLITKDIHLVGAGAATTTILAPATLPIASDPDSFIIRVDGSGVEAEISGFTISGPGPSGCGSIRGGIYVRNSAYANIHDNILADIRDNTSPVSGCQNGVAILVGRQAWATTGTATIANNQIIRYQKGGIVVDNTGSDAIITGNTITGIGTTNITAQNGIQVSRGATATLTGNTVTGNSYNLGGSEWDWGAAGILLYQPGAVTLAGGNNVSGNDQNLYIEDPTSPVVVGAEVFGPVTGPLGSSYQVINDSSYPINLTQLTVDGVVLSDATTAQLLTVAGRIWDGIDDDTLGVALLKTGYQFVDPEGSIQAAIDAATPGDKIYVAAGTYDETGPLTINKANITVQSFAGAASTIIDVQGTGLFNGVEALAGLGNVTLDGFTVRNFTQDGIKQSYTQKAGTAFHVLNNIVIPADDYLRNGIEVTGDGSTVIGNTVYGKLLTTDWASCGIQVDDASNVDVINNTILGDTIVDYGICVAAWDFNIDDVLIQGNTITHANTTIGMMTATDAPRTISNISILSNVLSDSTDGISATSSDDGSTLILTLGGLIKVETNQFDGITGNDLYVGANVGKTGGLILDGSPNWWGQSTGPAVADIVSDASAIPESLIGFVPYCTNEECTEFGYPPVHNTNRDTYFFTIQAAIDDAATQNGDEIAVAAGTYTEALVITKSVTLLGPNAAINPNTGTRVAEAVIRGTTTSPSLSNFANVNAAAVVIKGFTFDNMRIDNYNGTPDQIGGDVITNNIFTNVTGTAIYLRDGRDAPGLYSTGVEVSNNKFNAIASAGIADYQAGTAIIVKGAEASTVSGNVITNPSYNGIQLARSNGMTVTGNVVTGAPQPALQIAEWNAGTFEITGNTLSTSSSEKAAVRLYAFANNYYPLFNFTGNTIQDSKYAFQIGRGDGATANDIRDANYSFSGNTFTNIEQYRLIVYLNAAASSAELTEMNTLFSQVYVAGSVASQITTAIPFTYVVGLPLHVFVDDDFTPASSGGHIWGYDAFATINGGIAGVATGGTVTVADGTYNEAVIVDKAGVTLHSVNGRADTIIDVPNGTLTTGIRVLGTGLGSVTIDGFTVRDFTEGGIIQGMASRTGTTVHFLNNELLPAATYLRNGIQVTGDGSTVIGNIVHSQYLTVDWSSTAIGVVDASNVTVQNNTITGVGNYGIAVYVYTTSMLQSNVQVLGNTIDGIDVPLAATAYNNGTVNGVNFELNKVTHYEAAIEAEPGASGLAVLNIDATHNWWGSRFGPQGEIWGDPSVIKWCATAACDTFLPNDSNVVEATSADSQTGAIKIYVPHITILLKNGTVIQNSSPCFEIYASYTTITTESIGGAQCVPTSDANAIEIADDLVNIVIQGIEFVGNNGTDGLHFAGTVTDTVLVDNWFHNFKGDGIEFAEPPAGVINIQGNLFQNNAGVGINNTTGTTDLTATYNSWGDVLGPTGPNGDGVSTFVTYAPFTHVDLYLVSSGSLVANQVLTGQTITYTVYAHVVNANAVDFRMSYPANLTRLGAPVNSGTFSESAVFDTSVPNTIRFYGLAPLGTSVTGNVPVFQVTFTAGTPIAATPMNLDETTDSFGMIPYQSSANIYAAALNDGTVTILASSSATGTLSMQGRSTRLGIPVTLTSTELIPWGPYLTTTLNQISNNLVFSNVAGGTYLFTTNQPRYLNVSADLAKTALITANKVFAALELKGGNAVWTDNVININDASIVGFYYGSTDPANDGDVNFDGKINIQDLAMVGGNFYLTSATAYASWVP